MRIDWSKPVIGRGRVGWRKRVVFWVAFLGVLAGSYYWQPQRVEFFPPAAPTLPRATPEAAGLFSKGARVLMVAGHPDDSEFYLGGTMLKMFRAGATIRLVVMTDGDKAYYPFGVPDGLKRTRRAEQREAAKAWGGDVTFLGFRDGRLRVDERAVGGLLAELEQFRPDVVIAFDSVYRSRVAHGDHINSGRVAQIAMERWGGSCVVALYATRAPNCFVDIESVWLEKADQVAVHKSQFNGERLQSIRGFLAQRAFSDGERGGLEMAESLRVYRR